MDRFLRWLYTTRLGRCLRPLFLHNALLHRAIHAYAGSRSSTRFIGPVARAYGIDLDEAVVPPGGFRSFNEFFVRAVRPGARPFDPDPDALASPADSMLQLVEGLSPESRFAVKGSSFQLGRLLGDREMARGFDGGVAAIFRLAPGDCHRLYFPCDGRTRAPRRLHGAYYSVSPFPGNDQPFFSLNRRTVSLFESDRFGTLGFVDIAGFLIAAIRFVHGPGTAVKKGDARSCFEVGGSTLVLLCRRGAAVFRDDLRAASARGDETPVRIGETVARRQAGPGFREDAADERPRVVNPTILRPRHA